MTDKIAIPINMRGLVTTLAGVAILGAVTWIWSTVRLHDKVDANTTAIGEIQSGKIADLEAEVVRYKKLFWSTQGQDRKMLNEIIGGLHQANLLADVPLYDWDKADWPE